MNRETLNKMADTLQQGAPHIEAAPHPLQPTEHFLDHANRDVRRHFSIVNDVEGRSFFLRPDFTLPICMEYAEEETDAPLCYFYHGRIWLWSIADHKARGQAQMGIEHIGVRDIHQTSAAVMDATYQALLVAGCDAPFLRMGDTALFDQLVKCLDLPDDWRLRLQRLFRQNTKLALFFEQAQEALTARIQNKATIECSSRAELEDFLAKKNITHIGQRSLDEIVERLGEQNALHRADLPKKAMEVIKSFLKLPDAYPERALENIAQFAKTHQLNFDAPLHALATNWQKMQVLPLKKILSEDKAVFSTHFQGTHLNYYTGFVFSFLTHPKAALALAGGGQYNGLLKALTKKDIHGFGATIYLDELAHV